MTRKQKPRGFVCCFFMVFFCFFTQPGLNDSSMSAAAFGNSLAFLETTPYVQSGRTTVQASRGKLIKYMKIIETRWQKTSKIAGGQPGPNPS